MATEPELIELIDVDPEAFAVGERKPDPAESLPASSVGRTSVAVAMLLVAAAITSAALWPRADNSVRFTVRAAEQPTLTDQLVLGDPSAADLRAVNLREAEPTDGSTVELIGMLFAGDGATIDTGPFLAHYSDTTDEIDQATFDTAVAAADPENVVTVDGEPALLEATDVDVLQVRITALTDGLIRQTVSAGLPVQRVEEAANAMSIDGTTVRVDDRAVLDGLEQLVTMSRFVEVFDFLSLGLSTTGRTGVEYVGLRGEQVWVSSIPVTEVGAFASMQFIAGPTTIEVQALPAIVREADFIGNVFNGVYWEQGGRLIGVTGTADVDTLLALAETVRPATDTEWESLQSLGGNR